MKYPHTDYSDSIIKAAMTAYETWLNHIEHEKNNCGKPLALMPDEFIKKLPEHTPTWAHLTEAHRCYWCNIAKAVIIKWEEDLEKYCNSKLA